VELVQARAIYKKEIDFATRPIRDAYLSKLERAEAQSEAAAAMREEPCAVTGRNRLVRAVSAIR